MSRLSDRPVTLFAGSHWTPALVRCRRGANLVEYILILGCVAILALGGFRAFGRSVDDKVSGQAQCISNLSDCGAGQGDGPLAPDRASVVDSAAASTASNDSSGGDNNGGGEGKGWGERLLDVGKGIVVDGLWGTVTGIWDLGVAIVTDPVGTAEGLWYAVSHPGETIGALWDGVTNAWNENPERVIGAGIFELITLPVAALKAAKAAKIARATRVVDAVDNAGDTARAIDKVDDATDAARATDDAAAAAARRADDVPRGPPGATIAADVAKNGRLSMDDVRNMVPEGTPNTWNPGMYGSDGYTGPGFRYEWVGSDGTKYKVWGHGANPNAPPGTNAANGPTVRVQIGNRYATTNGDTVRNVGGNSPQGAANANNSHIPLDGYRDP